MTRERSPSLEILKQLEKYNNSVDFFFDSKIERLIISGKKSFK